LAARGLQSQRFSENGAHAMAVFFGLVNAGAENTDQNLVDETFVAVDCIRRASASEEMAAAAALDCTSLPVAQIRPADCVAPESLRDSFLVHLYKSPIYFLFCSYFSGIFCEFGGFQSQRAGDISRRPIKFAQKFSQTLDLNEIRPSGRSKGLDSQVKCFRWKFQKHWLLFSIFFLSGSLADGRHLHLAIDKATALTIFHQEERRQKRRTAASDGHFGSGF
jgi:hypothetical protein